MRATRAAAEGGRAEGGNCNEAIVCLGCLDNDGREPKQSLRMKRLLGRVPFSNEALRLIRTIWSALFATSSLAFLSFRFLNSCGSLLLLLNYNILLTVLYVSGRAKIQRVLGK